jgi:membrane-bound metal-dependent hydrolase YbcI (DUF457 family)
MTGKTHQLIGLTAAVGAFFAIHPNESVSLAVIGTIITGSFFGSILPDIDQPTSNFWDSVPMGNIVSRPLTRTLGGHRNFTHSILGVVLFSWLMAWFVQTVFRPGLFDQALFLWSFEIGFIAHLLADAVTVQGIPLFWPLGSNMGFPPRPFHGIRIVTGKWFESLVVVPGVFIVLGGVVLWHNQQLCSLIPFFCKNL